MDRVRRRPSWPSWVFRIGSTATAVIVFDQAVFAGAFLGGEYGALHDHRENATWAGIAMLVLAVSAVLLRWPGGGPWWPMAACLGIFGLIGLQIAIGFARILWLHVPLGAAIIVASALMSAWSWRRG
jgi:hypothetical protein